MQKSTRYKFLLSTDEDFLINNMDRRVTVPDTVNNAGVDIPGGLLDQAIFGPLENYSCKCKKYTGLFNEGVICEKCGVEVGKRKLRFEREGYIQLPVPYINPLYEDELIRKVLKLNRKAIKDLHSNNPVYFKFNPKSSYRIRIDKTDSELLKQFSLYIDSSELELIEDGSYYYIPGLVSILSGEVFLGYGVKAIEELSKIFDDSFNTNSVYWINNKSTIRNFSKGALTSRIIRLQPAGFRDVSKIDDIVTVNDINIIYKSILSASISLEFMERNCEGDLEKLISQGDYLLIYMLMLQDIKGLYFGGLKFKNKPISNYSKILNKKGGLVRNSLLGQRSIFSGRSVNSTLSPKLISVARDEVIVPYVLAKNLFRLQLMNKLNKDYDYDYNEINEMINENHDIVIKELYKSFSGEYYVYLTRAPALYGHSLMGFRLTINDDRDDKTLIVHPMINSMFNLDHDGDTMALFLPLSKESQLEVVNRGLVRTRPFYDKTGDSVYELTLEHIYGLFNATSSELGELKSSLDECEYYSDYIEENGIKVTKGSTLIESYLSEFNSTYYTRGEVIDKKRAKKLINSLLINEDIDEVLEFFDKLAIISSDSATESGLSFLMKDLIEVDKSDLVKIDNPFEYQHEEERLIDSIKSSPINGNNIRLMIESGAKGNYSQVKQIMISKGVLLDSKGNIMNPVKNSLNDGLTIDEFFTTIKASRKGIADKVLSTAESGYFMYRVTKSLRDLRILEHDCGTDKYGTENLEDIEGLYLAQNLGKHTSGTYISREIHKECMEFYKDPKMKVKVRNTIYCKTKNGKCRKCFGKVLSRDALPDDNENIGIIAGTTLSEIVTQLVLRNFHLAGSTDINKISRKSKSENSRVVIEEKGDFRLVKMDGLEYLIKKNDLLVHKTKADSEGDKMFSFSEGHNDISSSFKVLDDVVEMRKPTDPSLIATVDGTFKFSEVVDRITYKADKKLGVELPSKEKFIKVYIETSEGVKVEYKVPFSRTFIVPFNSKVRVGQILTTGNINIKEYYKYNGFDATAEKIVDIIKTQYNSQGIYVHKKYIELLTSFIVNNHPDTNDNYYNPDLQSEFRGVTRLGLNRSFFQHLSLGWYAEGTKKLLTDYCLGDTNADKIALGTYD